MRLRSFLLSAVLLAALPVAAQDARPEPRQGDADTDNVMPATPDDAHVLAWLRAMDDHVIALAEIARLSNPHQPTADFAKRLVDEHEVNRHRTEEVAGAIGAATEDDADDVRAWADASRRAREELDDVEGDAFTNAFLARVVADHEQAIARIDARLLRESHNDDLTAHLQATRARYLTHLEAARALVRNPDR